MIPKIFSPHIKLCDSSEALGKENIQIRSRTFETQWEYKPMMIWMQIALSFDALCQMVLVVLFRIYRIGITIEINIAKIDIKQTVWLSRSRFFSFPADPQQMNWTVYMSLF